MKKLLFVLLVLSACKGDIGPTGPAGPQGEIGPVGPQGPAGASVAYRLFEGAVNNTLMVTDVVDTGGVFPGVVCYVTHTSTPGVWLQHNTDTFAGTACGVVMESGSTYTGRAIFPASMVNAGWTARIILFWLP